MRGRPLVPVLVALLATVVVGCSKGTAPDAGSGRLVFDTHAGEVTLTVEIADTADERATGLMGRASLAPDSGMAFLWDEPVEATFWMKDTLIPLSIAFWDERGRVVAIRQMQPCRADPCPTYGAPEPYVGAAEADLGWYDDHGVGVGDTVVLYRPGS